MSKLLVHPAHILIKVSKLLFHPAQSIWWYCPNYWFIQLISWYWCPNCKFSIRRHWLMNLSHCELVSPGHTAAERVDSHRFPPKSHAPCELPRVYKYLFWCNARPGRWRACFVPLTNVQCESLPRWLVRAVMLAEWAAVGGVREA